MVVWIRFWRGWYKTLKHRYDVISYYRVFKIAHFVEHNTGYQAAKFHWPGLSRSNFIRGGGGGGGDTPLDLHATKKLGAYRLIYTTGLKYYEK